MTTAHGETAQGRLRLNVAQIAGRFEKLLILRLIHVGGRLISEAPELARETGFEEAWGAVGKMAGPGLGRASRHPLLDAWVSSAEELLQNGIHLRYPDAHPSRHCKSFQRLALAWAQYLPDGARGRVEMLGRASLQLMFGERLLLAPRREARLTLDWSLRKGVLRIDLPQGQRLLEADLSGSGQFELVPPEWSAVEAPRVGPLAVDVWTPEYQGHGPLNGDADALAQSLRQARGELNESLAATVDSTCRCLSGARPGPAWVAGVLRFPPGERVGGQGLLQLACRDAVERLLRLHPVAQFFGPPSLGSDFRPLFVDLASRRAAARLLGQEVPAEDSGSPLGWEALARKLAATEQGLAILDELGEEPLSGQSARSHSAPAGDQSVLEVDLAEGPDRPPHLSLKKTRRKQAFSINDWSALNVLAEMSQEQRLDLLREFLPRAEESEEAAFGAAAAAYVMGRFQCSASALLRCLEHDSDVEEYWHLLAFALRHLSRLDEFNDIVFNARRGPDLLQRLSPLRKPLEECES